jgi:hypothetical protein
MKKTGGTTPPARLKRRCDNNIKMNLKELGCGGRGLSSSDAEQREERLAVVNEVMYVRVP